jgi:hypothetical protein
MLIVDDYLLFRALQNDYSWLPAGHDPADLATTTDWHFRFLSSIMKPTLEGVHSNRFALLDTDTQEKLLARALSPAPIVSLLDFRLSVNAAATIRATYRRVGFVIAGAIASFVSLRSPTTFTKSVTLYASLCITYLAPPTKPPRNLLTPTA